MTDMEGTQEAVSAATSVTDDELINLLVPPRRPRWQTALIVLVIAVVLVGIVLLSESGVVAPRLNAELSHWGPDKRAFTVAFRIHNEGWTSTQVRAVDASQSMFGATHVLTPLPQTLDPDETIEVTVRFDSFDCQNDSTGDRTREIRVRARNSFGLTVTRAVKVDGFDVEQDGWPATTTAYACGNENG